MGAVAVKIEHPSASPVLSMSRAVRAVTTGSPAALEQDQAFLSAFASRIAGRLNAVDSQQTEKVNRVRVDYETGGYSVDPLALSRAIISDGLGFTCFVP